MRDWLVTADDRTGAFEVAGEIAGVAGSTLVTVCVAPTGDGVVDLSSRHLPPSDAAQRASAMPTATWNAHKIDSTLRGNWAVEVRARQCATGRRVLVIAAWPAMGRTCSGGVVHVHGIAIGDVRDGLPEAELLSDLAGLRTWIGQRGTFAVIDVTDTGSMAAIAEMVAGHDMLIAGPAGPIAAVFAACRRRVPSPPPARCSLPALVVCGSATELSHRQVGRLVAAIPEVDVLAAPPVAGDLEPEVATELARKAHARMAARSYRTVVLVGGDTAGAVLGGAARRVGGVVAPGMPWSRDERGAGPLVVTKAGGFGGVDALVTLFGRETE